MFEYLYSHFEVPSFFRLFNYVTFRALMASITAMAFAFLFGDKIIRCLQQVGYRENIRNDGPQSHQHKQGTPTMGGILILSSMLIACFLFGNLHNVHFVLLVSFTLLFGAIGFADDYVKVVLNNKKGLRSSLKLILTLAIALGFCIIYYYFTPAPQPGRITYNLNGLFMPFVKGQLWRLPLSLAFVFWILVIVGSAHAVNLSDGLDGLATGNVSIVTLTMGVLAYLTGTPLAANYLNIPVVVEAHEVSVFLAALTGAGVGFLWFNASPARVFMGDTGSLALGSALGMSAIILKKEFLLALAGGIFVLEAISVILQVASYKLYGKRIFKMAPILIITLN